MDSSTRSGKFTPRAFAAGFSGVLILSLMLVGAVSVFAASAAVNLDQCRNGGLVLPPGTQTAESLAFH